MFKKSDVGRKIKILNRNNAEWLKQHAHYEIEKYLDSLHVVLKDGTGNSWAGRDGDYQFINESLQVGDEVILVDSTQSIRKDEIKLILGFVDENKEKIVVEGALPGGWIPAHKVLKLININEYRLKSLYEIIHSYGIQETLSFIGINEKNLKLLEFGQPLKNLKIKRNGSGVFHEKLGIFIPEILLEKVDGPIKEYDIFLTTRVNMLNILGNTEHKFYIQFSPHENKPLSEIYSIKNNEQIINMLEEMKKTSVINTKLGKCPHHFLKLKQLNEKVEDKIDPALPF